MTEPNANLIALIEVLTAGQATQLERIVRAAFMSGASRDDLLTAIEIGRRLADVPAPVLTQACATVHAWDWMETYRVSRRRDFALHTT